MNKFATFDAHIHTKHSACGNEEMNVKDIQIKASENALSEISLTDHFRIGGNIERFKILRKEISKLPAYPKVFLSCESEITVLKTCSLSLKESKICDYVSITFSHLDAANRESFLPTSPRSIAKYFMDMFYLAIEIPYAKVILHPFCTLNSPFGPIEDILEHIDSKTLDRLLRDIKKSNKILELNPKHLTPSVYLWMVQFFKQAKAAGCRFCGGSDAHRLSEVGRHRHLFKSMIEDVGLNKNDFWTPSNYR